MDLGFVEQCSALWNFFTVVCGVVGNINSLYSTSMSYILPSMITEDDNVTGIEHEAVSDLLLIEVEWWRALKPDKRWDPEELRLECENRFLKADPEGLQKPLEECRLQALYSLHRIRKKHFGSANRPDLSPLEKFSPSSRLSPRPPNAITRSTGHRTHALLIGINNYLNTTPLSGCVKDAQNMLHFLKDYLAVPGDQIKTLLDEHATRANILRSLHDIFDRSGAREGDHFFVHYSGHGSSYDTRDEYPSTILDSSATFRVVHSLPAICPVDRGTEDFDGQIVQDIILQELCSWIAPLLKEHRYILTVVMDCCHSGNTPDISARPEGLRIRYAEPLASVVHEDYSSRSATTESSLLHSDLAEYAGLTACRDYERAYERVGNESSGLFSTRFLEVATSEESDGVTFEGIAELMGPLGEKYTRQTPIVRGKRRTQRFWDTPASSLDQCRCGCDNDMAKLRSLERELWKKSGKTGALDPDDVLSDYRKKMDEAKRACSLDSFKGDLANLTALGQLQSKRKVAAFESTRISNLISKRANRFWALIIGINNYVDLEPLRGCIADAHNMKNYLVDHLSVPEGHVSLLLDIDASRTNIWQSLYSLIDRTSDGDQLVMYFSGRGTLYCPSLTRAICPADRGTLDADGKQIQDITETDVYRSLSELRHVNGSLPTMIWDCSFSPTPEVKSKEPPQYGSLMNKYATPLQKESNTVTSRSDHQMNEGDVNDVLAWGEETSSDYPIFGVTRTILLLTACRKGEMGYEVFNRGQHRYEGQFTTSFLRVLIVGHHQLLTFSDVLKLVSNQVGEWSGNQTPEVIGYRKHDPIWE